MFVDSSNSDAKYHYPNSEIIGSLPKGITSKDAAHLWMLGFREVWVHIIFFFLFNNAC
jgi:hypothetical protein